MSKCETCGVDSKDWSLIPCDVRKPISQHSAGEKVENITDRCGASLAEYQEMVATQAMIISGLRKEVTYLPSRISEQMEAKDREIAELKVRLNTELFPKIMKEQIKAVEEAVVEIQKKDKEIADLKAEGRMLVESAVSSDLKVIELKAELERARAKLEKLRRYVKHDYKCNITCTYTISPKGAFVDTVCTCGLD